MHILVLVIVSFDKPVYYDMLQVWRERVCSRSDVWFIQCKPASEWIGDVINDILDTSLKDRFELDIANKTLFIRGDECLIPGILHKTVEALSFFLLEEGSNSRQAAPLGMSAAVPFIWRTNLSSVLDFAGLQRYLGTINSSGFYGGYIGLGSLNNGSSTFFASGAGFLMSRDVAKYLVLNKQFLRWDLIDDVAIGALLEPKFSIVPIERCWIQSGEEVVGSDGVFHYRCESYQHLRTVEFMQYVVRGLGK